MLCLNATSKVWVSSSWILALCTTFTISHPKWVLISPYYYLEYYLSLYLSRTISSYLRINRPPYIVKIPKFLLILSRCRIHLISLNNIKFSAFCCLLRWQLLTEPSTPFVIDCLTALVSSFQECPKLQSSYSHVAETGIKSQRHIGTRDNVILIPMKQSSYLNGISSRERTKWPRWKA